MDDPGDYARKRDSDFCVTLNIAICDLTIKYKCYSLMIYLSSKLTERQAMGENELFYNHAQLSAIFEAKEIKRGTKLHKVIEQNGDTPEAIGGICERVARADAKLLKELSNKKEDVGL